MKTCEGDADKKRYIGTVHLVLTDESNVNHLYNITCCIYDPETPVNVLGIPVLSELFDDAADGPDTIVEDDGTTILSSGRRSNFKWEHGKNHHHFTHPDSTLLAISLYQGPGYFSAFFSRIESVYNDRVNFSFSSAFYLKPDTPFISDDESDAESKAEDNEGWFYPKTYISDYPETTESEHPSQYFKLGMSLSHFDGRGKSEIVVYKGSYPDGLSHKVRTQDGSRLTVYDYHLCLKLQPYLSNITSTPIAFRDEINRGITK